ncbi:MAG: methyltransferase domain-containing protein [Syntrophobacteraceae bacterium]
MGLIKQLTDLFRTQKTSISTVPRSPQSLRIAYSCVLDAKPHFEWQAFLWLHSLLRNVGCNPFDLKIHCMPGVSPHFRRSALDLGAHVIDVTPFEGGHSYCNKIQQCFSGVFHCYDKVILTDTDLFFLAPPPLPGDKSFAAKIVDLENPPLETLRALYKEACVKPSGIAPVDCAISRSEQTFKNNFNGGFYCVNVALLEPLGQCWRKNALWLLDRIESLGTYKNHVDQIAMAITLDELKVDVAHLSAQVNFPVHLPQERLKVLRAAQIDVLHYHSRVTESGSIKLTGEPAVDNFIARANKNIAAIIEENFDNALFWNNRYDCFPELGSGVGSRGQSLEYKREHLNNVVHFFGDSSVLEIGCGDLETSKGLNFKTYVGYDLSASALEIARAKRPDWQFVQGSIDDAHRDPLAELVMCIDVLIHQKDADQYRELLYNLARATGQRLIVSGYETTPSFTSDITAYHEPLSTTLRKTGKFNEIIQIGKYRDVCLFVADTRPTGPALHANDIPLEVLNAVLPLVHRPDLLRAAMDWSRERLGFFTKTSSRALEYPWLLETLSPLGAGVRTLDIGAGVSPLPFMLAEHGMLVDTLDSHPVTRTRDRKADWNEWGFMDYGETCPHISSSHVDVLEFHPRHPFDVIYSISVLEHMSRPIRERTLELAASWMKSGGILLLTLDLIPDSDDLWNMSEGRIVDPSGSHGVLNDIVSTLRGLGVEVEDLFVQRNIPYSRTDVAFVRSRKL